MHVSAFVAFLVGLLADILYFCWGWAKELTALAVVGLAVLFAGSHFDRVLILVAVAAAVTVALLDFRSAK